jgi:ketosteroid isomerase-like protein
MGANSELLLAGYEAWNRDDCDAWLELLDPEIEIRTSGVFPDLSDVYRGHRRAAKFWRQMHEPWDLFRIDVEAMDEEGDWVAAAIRFRARGVDSGHRYSHLDRRVDSRRHDRRRTDRASARGRPLGPAGAGGGLGGGRQHPARRR